MASPARLMGTSNNWLQCEGVQSLVREDVILRSGTMGQPGFFDAERRLAALSKKGDPLEAISALVPWESFRADIEAVALTPEAEKKSRAGRKPFDALLMFRMLILQSLYNLSDEQIEYQVGDRMSFTRFLGLEFEDDIPDGTTLWVFREKLAQAGLVEKLFDRFNGLAFDPDERPSTPDALVDIVRSILALVLDRQHVRVKRDARPAS